MKKLYVILISGILFIGHVCYGQSNIGVSPSGYLTSLPPEIPTLAKPSNMATDQPVDCELTWQSQIHTSSYSFEVSQASDFSTLVRFSVSPQVSFESENHVLLI